MDGTPDPGRIGELHGVQRAVHGDVLNVKLPRRKARPTAPRAAVGILTGGYELWTSWFGFYAS